MQLRNTAIRMNIYKLLAERNLNQSDLPFSKSQVSKLLNGKTKITDLHLNQIAEFFNVSVEELTDQSELLADFDTLNQHEHIYDIYDKRGQELITANGKDFISNLGDASLTEIIKGILLGNNVRDLTETITRNRLLFSNAAILDLMLNTNFQDQGTEEYLNLLSKMLNLSSNNNERLLSLWMLGLTKKGLDNIVRGPHNLLEYTDKLNRTMCSATADIKNHFGEISGVIEFNGKSINLDWDFFNRLFTVIGAQTLTIRGSSKSMSGKLFEKLILGSLLSLLDFKYCREIPTKISPEDKLFWLSSTDENDRETDATIVFNGNAISIDLGFIGQGNPEIALDKVTRFRNYKEIGKMNHVISTIIIVDTVGENSNLFNMANDANGHLFQMNNANWVLDVSKCISNIMSLDLNILSDESQFSSYIETNIEKVDLNEFL